MAVCPLRLHSAVPGSGAGCWRVCLRLGFRCAPPLPGVVWVCVCVCVLLPYGPLLLLAGVAVQMCVLGSWLPPRPATPGWGVLACACLCGRPACMLPFLAGVCGVRVRAGLGFWLCSASLGLVVNMCVCACGCPACTPFVLGPTCGVGVFRCCGWGLPPPPSPFVSFFWQRREVTCRGLVVSVAGCPGPGIVVSVRPSPLVRAAPSGVFWFFFFLSVVFVGVIRVSLLPLGRCSRLGVAGF